MIDTRLVSFLVWGGGCLVLASIVLWKRYTRFRKHRRDRRKAVRRDVRRDVVSGGALWLTAAGSAGATFLVLFGEQGSTARGFLVALALGAFVGALLIMATEEDANGYGEADTGGSYDIPQAYDPAGDH